MTAEVLVEFRGQHYASINIANEVQMSAVFAVLAPLLEAGDLI